MWAKTRAPRKAIMHSSHTRDQLLARLASEWKGEVGPVPEPDETWMDEPA